MPEAGGIGRDLVAVLGAATVAAVELWRPGTLFVEAIAAVGDGVAGAAWELAFIVRVAVQRFPSGANENILGTGSTRFGRALLLAVPGKVCQAHVGIGTDLVAAAAKDGLVEGRTGTGVGCLATISVEVESGILYETQVVVEALIPVTTFVGVTRETFAFVFAGGTSWLRTGAGGSATPHVGEARAALDAGCNVFEPLCLVAGKVEGKIYMCEGAVGESDPHLLACGIIDKLTVHPSPSEGFAMLRHSLQLSASRH